MDMQCSWYQPCRPSVQDVDLTKVNFVLHFDGGTRGQTCSASAWILEVGVKRGNAVCEFPLAMGGQYLDAFVPAFTAELIALEACTDKLRAMVESLFPLQMAIP